MLKIKVGDVVKNFLESYDILVQGCNCFHTMGAGIAKTLSKKWPAILEADKRTNRGDTTKLGTFSIAEIIPGKIVVNAYTQYGYGSGALNVHAFEDVFKAINTAYGDKKICCPAVGMGLAGGKPEELLPILQKIFKETDLAMFVLDETVKQEFEKWS